MRTYADVCGRMQVHPSLVVRDGFVSNPELEVLGIVQLYWYNYSLY